jgi:hypothetical protein
MRYLILILLLTAACAPKPEYKRATGLGSIQKQQILFNDFAETAPVVLNNNLYYIRGVTEEYGHEFKVHDVNLSLISTGPMGFAFISAIVDNGTVYVFGSENNHINMTSSIDLINWSMPQVVFTNTSEVYNTSVTKTPDGFTMAYEVNIGGPFTFRFLKSPDLMQWTDTGAQFANSYTACPMLRYIDGTYYVVYLSKAANWDYISMVAKSTDLVTWDKSSIPLLAPALDDSEWTNTSDVDMIEVGGRVEINYGIGNQAQFGATKRAVYHGTMKQMFNEVFNE